MTRDVIDDFASGARPSNTLVVLALVILAALTFSYLGAYALPDALIDSQMIPPWPLGADPRPHWMGFIFIGVLGVFLAGTTMVRLASLRQLRRIDQTGEE
jgi:hypothetical protein